MVLCGTGTLSGLRLPAAAGRQRDAQGGGLENAAGLAQLYALASQPKARGSQFSATKAPVPACVARRPFFSFFYFSVARMATGTRWGGPKQSKQKSYSGNWSSSAWCGQAEVYHARLPRAARGAVQLVHAVRLRDQVPGLAHDWLVRRRASALLTSDATAERFATETCGRGDAAQEAQILARWIPKIISTITE